MRHLLCLLVAATLAAPTIAARAAEVRIERGDDRPRVFVEGDIKLGDAARFRRAVRGLPVATIVLDGPGGKLIDALTIGELLRERGDHTVVAADGHCTSACALIWLAGEERTLEDGGSIGFHAAAARQGDTLRMTASGNAIVGAYLTRLGYPLGVVVMATEADHTSMAYLTAERAARSGLTYRRTAALAPRRRDEGSIGTEGGDRAVSEVMEFYFASANAPPHAMRALAGRLYDERVVYFGEAVSRGELIRRREAYTRRWPHFSLVRAGPPQVSCAAAGARCIVFGVARFTASNPAGRTALRGTLRYEVELIRDGGSYRITDETSTITSRIIGPNGVGSTALTQALQTELARLGCEPGPVDGLWGRRSAGALERFAENSTLAVDATSPSYVALTLTQYADDDCRTDRDGAAHLTHSGHPL